MKCPDCNKFVGIEMADPELEVFDVDSELADEQTSKPEQSKSELSGFDILRDKLKGATQSTAAQPAGPHSVSNCTISGIVRLVQQCAECSTKLADANIELEEEQDFDHIGHCEGEVTFEDESADNTDRFEGKGRGAKHFYGAEVSMTLKCEECGASKEVSFIVEEQASNFESLV
jgi:hypothetical protein